MQGGGLTLLVPFLAAPVCADYSLSQYHHSEPTPWQRFRDFDNVCRGELCHPDEGDCVGTEDAFTLEVDAEAARDRTMFFEGCEGCSGTCDRCDPNTEFRTNGAYAYFQGEGTAPRVHPVTIGQTGRIGHVREYHRGACSTEIDLDAVDPGDGVPVPVAELLGAYMQHEFESSDKVESCAVLGVDVQPYLGSRDCGSEVGEDFDFLRATADFSVVMGPAGGEGCIWRVGFDFWFRLVPGGGARLLDVEDYGLEYSLDDTSVPGAWWCDEFWETLFGENSFYGGMHATLQEYEDDPYATLFGSLLDYVEDLLWQTFSFLDCNDRPCPEFSPFEARCHEGECQYRPGVVYGVNLYPAGLELILARTTADPEYVLLGPGGAFAMLNTCLSPTFGRVQSARWAE